MDYERIGDADDVEVDIGSEEEIVPTTTTEFVSYGSENKFVPRLTKYELARIRAELLNMLKNGHSYNNALVGATPEETVEKVIKDGRIPFKIRRGALTIDPNKYV